MLLGHWCQDKHLSKSVKSKTYAGSHSLDLFLKFLSSVSQSVFK